MPSVRLDDGVEPRSLDKDVNADNAGELSLSQSGDHFKPYAAEELCRLARVFETVEDCPWYFGAMSGQEAKIKLRGTPNGTFLLRDSSDSRFVQFLYFLYILLNVEPRLLQTIQRIFKLEK